jgi:pimeloyl-ACP methyl ester carboxylesterase
MQTQAMTPDCLVMLPGLMCDDAVWVHQQQALTGVHCMVPSYGHLSSIVDMARMVLETAPSQRFSVAGHSMGGRVALEMVRLAPERIQRLALLDTGMDAIAEGAAGEQERDKRMALLHLAQTAGMRAMGQQWAKGMVHPDRLQDPVFTDILDMIERKTPSIFEAQIQALLKRPNARDVLSSLRCPTTFICGREDLWSPLSRHVEMQGLVPNARLVAIEHSGHMSTMEQPEAVSRALLDWMALNEH